MSIFDTGKLRLQLASLDLTPDKREYFEKMLNDIDEVGKHVKALYEKYPELGRPGGVVN